MTNQAVRIRKRLSRLLLVGLTRLINLGARLVPYRTAVALGGMLGFIAFYALTRERRRAKAHLALVFPSQGAWWVDRTARRVFIHLGTSLLEIMALRPRRIPSLISFHGLERLEEAAGRGKGVIYVTGHIGNWELMGAAVAQRFSLSVVAAPIEPEAVNDMIVRLRADRGVRTILRNRPGAAKELIKIFRENRVLGILIDQDTDVEGAFVDFLGRPAWTPTAAAQMAIKFGAAVVFGYIRRDASGRHTVEIEGPLELPRTGSDEENIRTATAMLNKKIETAILRNPEQWVWMHRRWRRQP